MTRFSGSSFLPNVSEILYNSVCLCSERPPSPKKGKTLQTVVI